MRAVDVTDEALMNVRRNKGQTWITAIAIFIGAFILIMTNSIGTGVSTYISAQLGQIGNDGMLSVSQPAEQIPEEDKGLPSRYKESNVSTQEAQVAEGVESMGFSSGMLTNEDVERIAQIPGVERAEPTIISQPKFVVGESGDQWKVMPNIAASVMTPDLTAGAPFTAGGEENQIIIPQSFVPAFGYDSDEEAIGGEVRFAVDNALQEEVFVDAVIVGVNNKSLFGDSLSMNENLNREIISAQKIGLPEGVAAEDFYISAIAYLEPDLTDEQVMAIQDELVELGFEGLKIEDQIGSIQAVIDGILGIFSAFALLVLIAASFNIVSTLNMSVKERTREIGLMKAMGLPSSKVYALFSLEAVMIGLLGTLLGIGAALLIGTGIKEALTDTLLADLPGLVLPFFTFGDIMSVVILIMVISLIAGTVPSANAARKDPIEALRYE